MQNVNIKNVFFQKGKDIDNQKTIDFILYIGKKRDRKTVTYTRSKFDLGSDRDLILSLGFYLKNSGYNITGTFSEIALFFDRFKYNFDNYYI